MERLDAIKRGFEQFAKTESSQIRQPNLFGELVWLARRAVQEDKEALGLNKKNGIADVNFYLQRLLEIGFIFNEVFIRQEYPWIPQSETPRVVDFGGDIGGFSVLYWKSLAPKAKVTLVEANPSTATIASENFRRKGLQDVEVINAAVSEKEGETILYMHKAGVGYHASDFVGERKDIDSSRYHHITIPTIKPSTLIGEERIDLLKIDVEGSEGEILRELAMSEKLQQIDEIIMEFHNDPRNPSNSLIEVLHILNNAEFSIENVHRSGRARRVRGEPIDIYTIKPSETMLFMLQAKRNY